jgi:hypothetical protein
MHDELYEWDENGKPRRKRVLPDGASFHFPYIADHAAYGFSPTFADGSPDFSDPHRPGFRFSDIGDAARLAADQAYEERRERMQNAWRTKGDVKADAGDGAAPPRTRSLDVLRSAADTAYRDKCERLRNAWRNR